MKRECKFCHKAYDIRGVGPHESKCPKRNQPPQPDAQADVQDVLYDLMVTIWDILTAERKIKFLTDNL